MARTFYVLVASALLVAPLTATPAGWLIEPSVGSGVTLSPHLGDRIPTNVMLAGGYGWSYLKLELGLLGNLADVEHSKFDLELRPMVVIKPPLLPWYGRATVGVSGLLERPTSVVYGAALGVRIGALGKGVFLEAGALSRRLKVSGKEKDTWFAEGRVGAYFD